MSGHHSHSRPLPMQNNSHTSNSSQYRDKTVYESPGHSPAVEADRPTESRSNGQTQSSTVEEVCNNAIEDHVSPPQADSATSLRASARPHPAGPRSPNQTSSFSPQTSPKSEQQHTGASSSLAALVMDANASPKQHVEGFQPLASARPDGEKAPHEAAVSPKHDSQAPTQDDQTIAASRSPRHVRINDKKEDRNEPPSQEPMTANAPTGNSDSSYTPASSPPPKTPSSDDVTHHGDHETSTDPESQTKGASAQVTTSSPSVSDTSGVAHMDLATFPTQDLLRLLASLLQQIASANDTLREEVMSSKAEASSSKATSPSSRNRSRKSSTGDTVGKFTIPPFRPRPANAEGERRSSHTHSKSPTEADTRPITEEAGREVEDQDAGQDKAHMAGHVSGDKEQQHPASKSSPSTSSAVPANGDSGDDETSHPAPHAQEEQGRNASESAREEEVSPNTASTGQPPGAYRITTTAARQSLVHPSAILCFHARNVPTISIEAYLQRILKYCPITNEVFLSLLVYFDRMSKMQLGTSQSNGQAIANEVGHQTGIRGFAIDSYNVHRLVIAGITVASKFFSDVFYTNSRYAKVGGLPQSELNQLELQFLLLNDFNLVISVEEMQRYADQLLVYGQGKGMIAKEGPGIVYGHLPAMKCPSEDLREPSDSSPA
ncbi:hypothetical protein QFC22_000453 [Naganishia vaughanmartiniae]|uniref:Uncharacterized protein n=1 Tax=Naganishia vaughanmartiniae TaxID=1424756 RepID=A0ACC2XS09_9TREE|nr:hypothetical protein QFC22_000453 [Naganishia vaughanmartiniae]